MTTVKFVLFDGTYRMMYPIDDIPQDRGGEYVPLAEHLQCRQERELLAAETVAAIAQYQAKVADMERHINSLARETYELKGLIRRWIEIGSLNDLGGGALMADSQEALNEY